MLKRNAEEVYMNTLEDMCYDLNQDELLLEDVSFCNLLNNAINVLLNIDFSNWMVVEEYVCDLGARIDRLQTIENKLNSIGLNVELIEFFNECIQLTDENF